MQDSIDTFQVTSAVGVSVVRAVVVLPDTNRQNRACDCCQECFDIGCDAQCHNDCTCDGH